MHRMDCIDSFSEGGKRMNTVSYSVASIIQSYDSREGIEVMEKGELLFIDITKEFPSPGYKITIEKILNQDGELKVYFMVEPPAPDRVLPQVVTYKTLTIKIPKKELERPPSTFKVLELRMV